MTLDRLSEIGHVDGIGACWRRHQESEQQH
jgi:hypothetical protein